MLFSDAADSRSPALCSDSKDSKSLHSPSLLRQARLAFHPGEISLRLYLLVALLARLPAVFFSRGYDFMDHQFQYVDPAYHLGLGGSWWQPHEYVQGLRSWAYPGMLAGIFKTLSSLGLEAPVPMMVGTRFVHALVGLVPLAALWMLVVEWKGLRGQRPLLLFAALNAITVYASVQPTGPTFALGLTLTAVFLFEGPGRFWPFVSGLALGLAFVCRFQDAFVGPVLFVAGLVSRRYVAILYMSLGAAILVTLQGLMDLASWGTFLGSPFRYVAWNVFEGAASRYGREPFWYYLPFVAIALVLVPPFLSSGARALREGARTFPLPVAASTFYLFMHSLVERKALRFVLPALALLLVAYGFELLRREGAERRFREPTGRSSSRSMASRSSAVSFWYPHGGPIEAALTLSRQEDFVDRLLIVDGDEDALGGHYYLRREQVDVTLVERRNLFTWIRRERPSTPLYVLAVGAPLEGFAPPEPYALEAVGEFRNWPDLQRHGRRFLYRLVGGPKR